jgi:hypothetical protein
MALIGEAGAESIKAIGAKLTARLSVWIDGNISIYHPYSVDKFSSKFILIYKYGK